MAKPNFILPNKPAIKAGSILSYNYTDDLKFAAEPLDFSRNSSATRVNEQGLIEEVGYFGPQLVQNGDFSQEGSELITNGDFSTDSDWSLTNFSIINEKAVIDSSSPGYLIQSSVTEIGKTYRVEFTVSDYVEGRLRLRNPFINNDLESNPSNGTYVYYGVANDTGFQIQSRFSGEDYKYKISNVSVKEVGQNWTLGTGWSIGDGVVSANAPTGNLDQSLTATSGSKYRVTFTISNYVSGDIRWRFTGTSNENGALRSANGTYTEEITLTNNQAFLRFPPTAGVMDIDNVSVIEIIGDKPRIDYSDSSTEPSLLLEPQRTNSMPYSEDATNWSTQNNSVLATSNQAVSPDGTLNADKLIPASGSVTSNGGRYLSFASTASTDYSVSIFVKQAEYRYVTFSYGSSAAYGFHFDLQDGVIIQELSNAQYTSISREVESFTNGWYRLKISLTDSISQPTRFISVRPANELPTATNNNYATTGDGTSGIYVWGFQIEQGSYATSYIPTSGSAVTRLGETANNAGGAGVFNSEEGVLYAEIAALADDLTFREIALSDGTSNNRVELRFTSNSNEIQVVVRAIDGAVQTARQTSAYTITNFNKIAISYKVNDFSFWVNGVKVSTSTSGNTFSSNTLTELAFDQGNGSSPFYGKTKNLQVFNHALTDEELQTLTT